MNIFISYQSKDAKFVNMVSITLSRMGLEPIIVENTSLPGENITTKVLTALNQFDLFMPIITRNSITSQWMNQEIGYAIARKSNIMYSSIQSFDYILPIIEKGITRNIKGFLVNIEGIQYNRILPEITIANIVQVLYRDYIQGFSGFTFVELCNKCKNDMNISLPNYEEINIAIRKDQNYIFLCQSCGHIHEFSPLTFQIIKHWDGTPQQIEELFGQIDR